MLFRSQSGCPGLSGAPEQAAINSTISYAISDEGNVRTYSITTTTTPDGTTGVISALCVYPDASKTDLRKAVATAEPIGWTAAVTNTGSVHFAATGEGNGLTSGIVTVYTIGTVNWDKAGFIPTDTVVLAKITWASVCANLYPTSTTTTTETGTHTMTTTHGHSGGSTGEEPAGTCMVKLSLTPTS